MTSLLPCLLLAGTSLAEPAWHEYALRAYGGYVANVATMDARDGDERLKLGADRESGVAFAVARDACFDLDFALGTVSASGSGRHAADAARPAASRAVDLKLTSLYLTGKWRFNRDAGRLVPWLGAGVHLDRIEAEETETGPTAGPVGKNAPRQTGGAAGGCAAAGCDFYPARTGAVAFTLETRYRIGLLDGPVKAGTDGVAVLFGLKWDFGPRAVPP